MWTGIETAQNDTPGSGTETALNDGIPSNTWGQVQTAQNDTPATP